MEPLRAIHAVTNQNPTAWGKCRNTKAAEPYAFLIERFLDIRQQVSYLRNLLFHLHRLPPRCQFRTPEFEIRWPPDPMRTNTVRLANKLSSLAGVAIRKLLMVYVIGGSHRVCFGSAPLSLYERMCYGDFLSGP